LAYEADKIRRYTHDKIGFTSNLWSQYGLGDLDLHVGWSASFDHIYMTRTISLAAQAGALFPTGVRKDPYEPASIAFGNDGHYGMTANWVISVELKQDLTVGLHLGTTHLFTREKNIRLSVGQEPAMFSALVMPAQEKPGNCFVVSPFVTLGHLSDGLDFQVRYAYVRHAQNAFSDRRTDKTISSYLQKDEELITRKDTLSKWRAHYVSFNLTYDSAAIIKKNKIAPRFFISYDMPMDGSAFAKMHAVQLGAELHF
jgi:hypothetical protein